MPLGHSSNTNLDMASGLSGGTLLALSIDWARRMAFSSSFLTTWYLSALHDGMSPYDSPFQSSWNCTPLNCTMEPAPAATPPDSIDETLYMLIVSTMPV